MWARNSSGFHWLIWYSPVPRGVCIISMNFIVRLLPRSSRAVERGLQLGEIELLHSHHRLHRAARLRLVLVREHSAELLRNDLPGHAALVVESAALDFLAAVLRQLLPEAIDLRLRVDLHHERKALPEGES